MGNKLKRVVAIIALVFMLTFTVTLILYIFDKTMLNGAVGDLALWSGAFGLLLALVLWISRVFPSQQVKDEQRAKLYEEAEKLDEAERLKESHRSDNAEVTDKESVEDESEDKSEGDQ